jgi:HTH-type transcriptional regulator, sugar sensing transcriptional regulator
MDKILTDTLQLLELTQKEIQFFEACFALGSCTINEAVKKARLQRSTAYLLTDSLIQKGLLTEDYKNYRKILIAAEPKTLLRMLSSKQRIISRQEMELEERLPELQAIYQASETRPKVRVFEGNAGLISIMDDILLAKNEILLWSNQETESSFFTQAFHNKFIEIRKRKELAIRVLAVANDKGKLLKKFDHTTLRITKLLPISTSFSAETYIYGGKVAILDYKKDIIGIIIESEQIADAQKSIFELTWQSIKE